MGKRSQRELDFDVIKSDKLFDFLLEKGQIKLPDNHVMLPPDQLKNKKFCKFHNATSHSTNECRVFWQHIYDEDIAKMESRTTPIREGEDDEDIAMPRCPRIQETRHHCFGHNFLTRHRNGPFLDALERGRRRRRFGSGPSSRRSVDHSV